MGEGSRALRSMEGVAPLSAREEHARKIKLNKELQEIGVGIVKNSKGLAERYSGTPEEIERKIIERYGPANEDEDPTLVLSTDPEMRFEAVEELNKELGESNGDDDGEGTAVYVGPRDIVKEDVADNENAREIERSEKKAKERESRREFMLAFLKENAIPIEDVASLESVIEKALDEDYGKNTDYVRGKTRSIKLALDGPTEKNSYYRSGLKNIPSEDGMDEDKKYRSTRGRLVEIGYGDMLERMEKSLPQKGDVYVEKRYGSFSITFRSNDGSIKNVETPYIDGEEAKEFVPFDDIEDEFVRKVRLQVNEEAPHDKSEDSDIKKAQRFKRIYGGGLRGTYSRLGPIPMEKYSEALRESLKDLGLREVPVDERLMLDFGTINKLVGELKQVEADRAEQEATFEDSFGEVAV